ncbi:hypothetical protein IC229_05760 [Spirosoma sp. BT702]|uniref:Uncharacterized protein n=1 Tax=Spirosoma profusum TaxID=2771354 RepID=A0A926Y1J0_9BACT|nr:hypothetical protein [Spirosoma profusum]MBD2700131.1 hypothetical protein [Spirosoma profusum]
MTDLLFAGGNNPAGHYLIRCVPVIGVQSMPEPAAGGPMVVNGPPTFKSGYTWIKLYGTEGTKTYDEQQQEVDDGEIWNLTISLFLPGDSAQQRTALAQMVRHRFVVECQDNTGTWRRVGTKTQSLQLTYRFGVGGPMGSQRGATLTFQGTVTAPPPLVTGI